MSVMIGLYESSAPGARLLLDLTPRASSGQITTNEHGFERLTIPVELSVIQALSLLPDSARHVAATAHGGAFVLFEGRLEDPAIQASTTGQGLQVSALGYQRAYSDPLVTAQWTDSGVEGWRTVTRDELPDADPAKFGFDFTNQIRINLVKNTSYGNAPWTNASVAYIPPDRGTRQLSLVAFELEMLAPVGFIFRVESWNANFAGGFVTIDLTNATGLVQNRARVIMFTAADILVFSLVRNAANALYVGETGDAYVKLTNVRVLSTQQSLVSTTTTAITFNGTPSTITVASTAGLQAGRMVALAGTEMVTIINVLSSTQFTANVARAGLGYIVGSAVRAPAVYADEIARSLVASTAALNPTQVSTDTGLISAPTVDLLNQVYQDQRPAAILTQLAAYGDAAGNTWQWRVWDGRRLTFAPATTGTQTYTVDASDITIEPSLDPVYNQVYATYQEASGRTRRTTAATNADSVRVRGVTRQQAVPASTTSAVGAETVRGVALGDTANPTPRLSIKFDRLYTERGAPVPLWLLRAGDRLRVRNLQPSTGGLLEAARVITVARTTYDLATGGMAVEPANPLPELEALLARQQ